MSMFARVATAVLAGFVLAAWLWVRFGSDKDAQWGKTKGPDTPEAFAYKTAWYAVRSDDPDTVAHAFPLRRIQASSWESGLDRASRDDSGSVFMTPPIQGWVLIVGRAVLLDPDFERKLLNLSQQFGDAQYFASMRVSSAYIWARARSGKLECEFQAGDGASTIRKGNARELETQLGLKYFDDDSPEARQAGYYDRTDLTFPDEQDVLKVAQLWSVDPSKVAQYPEAHITGLSGGFTRYAARADS